ncbi:MAG TPA: hypothetical protein VMW29_01495 [Candidatus Bathyarchaeia archaeon]|nr:hypothetical protein [Candidatus Bathyarchaeia archaeon]
MLYRKFGTFKLVFVIGLLAAGLLALALPVTPAYAAGPVHTWTADELQMAYDAEPNWRRSFSVAVFKDNGDGALNLDPDSPYRDYPVENAQVKIVMAAGSEIADWKGGTNANGWTQRDGNFAITGITGLTVTAWPKGMTGSVLSTWSVGSHGEWPERQAFPMKVNPFDQYVSLVILVQ